MVDAISTFVQPPRYGQSPYHCLIISYETFRLHAASLAVPGACDLLICDEVRPQLWLVWALVALNAFESTGPKTLMNPPHPLECSSVSHKPCFCE